MSVVHCGCVIYDAFDSVCTAAGSTAFIYYGMSMTRSLSLSGLNTPVNDIRAVVVTGAPLETTEHHYATRNAISPLLCIFERGER